MAIEAATEDEHAATEVVVLPQADEVSTALSETTSKYQQVLAHVAAGRELAERYKGVVADVTTGAGYSQIAGIRTELREAWRYPVQKLQKEISKTLGTLQRSTNRHIDALIAEAEAHEAPFQALLDAEDDRKAKLRAEAEAKEAARKQAHAEAIAAISSMPGAAAGLSSAELEERLQAAKDIIVDDSYEEFQGQAQQAKDEAVRQLTGMLVAARADEAERAELEEERRRQAAFAEQQRLQREAAEAQAAQERAAREAAERETAELRARLAAAEAREREQAAERERAARERAEAIQRRIEFLGNALDHPPHELPSVDLEQAVAAMEREEITADLYGDRVQEAATIKVRALEALIELRCAAADRERREEMERQRREAEEAAAALHTRRCEMLSALVGAGENALLAVQDGSADVAELERNRALIADTELTAELWGELLQQAVSARSETLRKADEAIATTKERDRERAAAAEWRRQQEAEEAERQRQQEEADRAMRERHLRMQAAAPRMFALLKEITAEVTNQSESDIYRAALDLVREIEGA